MKIYFAGSIRGGRQNKETYGFIVNYLKKYGSVLSEHIGSLELTEGGERLDNVLIYNRDMAWIKSSDVMVAEVSTPSIGVGYEIREAEGADKKILCLYNNNINTRISAMIAGNKKLVVRNYTSLEDAFKHIDGFFKDVTKDL